MSLSSCISFFCRFHKSRNSKNEDSEKKTTPANVVTVELGSSPLTIEHNIQLNQDQQTAAEQYDSFESDDDDDQNADPANVTNPPDVDNYYQNQETHDRDAGFKNYVLATSEGDDGNYAQELESYHNMSEIKQELQALNL